VTGQSNIGATNDGVDSTACYVEPTNGVWYKLSLAFPAYIVVSTCNQADFNTQIAIYSGACKSFVCKAVADDSEGCGLTTRVGARVENPDIYILVFGYQGEKEEGNFDLTVTVRFSSKLLMEWKERVHDTSFCLICCQFSFFRNFKMIDAVDSQSLTLTGQYTTSGQQKVVAETTECYVETSNGV